MKFEKSERKCLSLEITNGDWGDDTGLSKSQEALLLIAGQSQVGVPGDAMGECPIVSILQHAQD